MKPDDREACADRVQVDAIGVDVDRVTKDRSDCSHVSLMPDRPSGASVFGFERLEHDSHPGEAGAYP